MAEEVTIVIKGENKASGPINDASTSVQGLGNEAKQTTDAVGQMNTGMTGATDAAEGMSPAMVAAGAAIAGAAAAAAAAVAAIGTLISVAKAAIDAFVEQDAVNRGLEQSLRGVGFAGASLNSTIAGIDSSIAVLAKSTMFGDEELKKMASTFVNVSGSAGVTREQMALMADMAQGMGKSTEEAARLMAQAMKGDLPRTLALTTSLTRDQIAEVKALEDPTARAAAATELLTRTFGGASENLNSYYKSSKNLEDAKGDFLQKIGEVITESGAFSPVLDGITLALNDMEAGVGENQNAISAWLIDAVAVAVDYMTTFVEILQFLSPVLAYVATAVENAATGFNSLKLAAQVVIDLFIALQSQVIGRLLQGITALLDGLSGVAGLVNDDLSASIKRAADATRGFGQLALGVSSAAFQGAADKTKEIGNNIVDSVMNIADLPDRAARFDRALGGVAARTRTVANNLRASKDAIGQVNEELDAMPTGQTGVEDGEAETATTATEAATAALTEHTDAQAKDAAETERRNQLASMRLALLREQDPYMQAVLTHMISEQEIRVKDLSDMERELELARAQMTLDASIAGAMAEEHAARMSALEAERQAREAIAAEAERQRKATKAYNDELLGGLNQAIPGLGALSAGLKNVSEVQWGTTEATESAVSALGGFASVGGQLAGMITSDRKKAAKVEAVFHAAAALGAFATWAGSSFTLGQFGVAAAQHTAAAVKFAAVAGSGTPAQAPSRGAAGGGAGGSGMMTRDRATAATSGATRQPDVVINVDMGSSTNLRDAVDTGRAIGQSVADAARNEFRL